ncbi:MAG: methylenetetrahydrofolate--tRNA-(uracil(54)-C(5))-methyltransferase (FADH(2)-oxidizing) TrmFO [Coriobacteriia bacterium]|nr:methylenetetrahydrofolate--tRNA-(uracil(54)-C(5))-methyltransferase (FADH(2)-oxidizing) TrmFO [Coriobacteriia bacterium]
MADPVTIVGAGLAGSEAAWQLAERGIKVRLIEMRPNIKTPIHQSGDFAELVCSNSFKSLDSSSAAGCLKNELAVMGSQLIKWAIGSRVAAGKALAVDRERFASTVTAELEKHRNISIERREFTELNDLINSPTPSIIATGPLTSAALETVLGEALGSEYLSFFDAAAPIVEAGSLDMGRLFRQSRYSSEEEDYLNAPLDRQQYEALVDALVKGDRVIARDFENADLFQACQPVEELARKGIDTLRFGALKPVGLTDPHTGRRPWAVVQLRSENQANTAYNLVGFQTNLAFREQERIFRLIPGLENAQFARFGVMHRNTFIDAPRLLSPTLAWKSHPHIHFAGQLGGTEGYVEAIASGLLASLAVYAQIKGQALDPLPNTTLFGALIDYATNPKTKDYQPMHVNYGIIRSLPEGVKNKKQRYIEYASRSEQAIIGYREANGFLDWLADTDRSFLIGPATQEGKIQGPLSEAG